MEKLSYLDDLVHYENTKGKKSFQVSYMKFEHEGEIDKVKKELRDLKLGELAFDEDNSDKIKTLEESDNPLRELGINGFSDSGDYSSEGIMSMSVKSKSIVMKDKIKFSSHASANYEANSHLRDEVLKRIKKVSKSNKPITKKLACRSFDISKSNKQTLEEFRRKILSTIIICSNYIAHKGRVGPGNSVIMSSKMCHYLADDLSYSHKKADARNPFKFGTLNGLNIIIDDSLNNKVIVHRLGTGQGGMNTSISLFYSYDEDKNVLDYTIEEIGDTHFNYIEFDVSNLNL